jgi:hypothetical protein
MSAPKVIIISGKQGSGKTTLQKEVQSRLYAQGSRVELINFADIIYKIHDFAINILEGVGIKRDIAKDGVLLQMLGTEWGRKSIQENIWCQIAKNRIEAMSTTSHNVGYVILGDCRFENEFDFFPDALSIRLECDKEIRKARCSQWRENDTHPSEVGLDEYSANDKFDLYFNTGTTSIEDTVSIVLKHLKDIN